VAARLATRSDGSDQGRRLSDWPMTNEERDQKRRRRMEAAQAVGGRLQVVGIGHHIEGVARYQAIFPRSTGPTVETRGPSPHMVDARQ
jgi:hypothetical protein